jgi:hypothetical protein
MIRYHESPYACPNLDFLRLADNYTRSPRSSCLQRLTCRRFVKQNSEEIYHMLERYRDSEEGREVQALNGKMRIKVENKYKVPKRNWRSLFWREGWSYVIVTPNFLTRDGNQVHLIIYI